MNDHKKARRGGGLDLVAEGAGLILFEYASCGRLAKAFHQVGKDSQLAASWEVDDVRREGLQIVPCFIHDLNSKALAAQALCIGFCGLVRDVHEYCPEVYLSLRS